LWALLLKLVALLDAPCAPKLLDKFFRGAAPADPSRRISAAPHSQTWVIRAIRVWTQLDATVTLL
jgi:hypothetical protein